jgi:UDP-sugar transporter A1/2/3
MKSPTSIFSAKAVSLFAGVCQQVALVLIIRYSKTQQHGGQDELYVPYLTSVAVMSAEIFKLCLSFVLEVITSSQSRTSTDMGAIRRSLSTLARMLSLKRESFKLVIPAALYLLQNNLLFVALSHLSVPTYQISSQGKLLATAIFSRVLLKKHLSAMQYCAITLLGLGVAVVQLSEYRINMSVQSASSGTGGQQDQWLGLLAVLVSCLTSGFAGVYFELVLKSNKQSVHFHNFQLAVWSIFCAIVLIICKDMSQVKSHGLFHGFDKIVVLIVVTQALTGFAVSMMLKYANALLKGFAISVAAIVASVASVFLFGARVDGMFFVGASMVGIAVKMYSGKDHKDNTCTPKIFFKSKALLGLGLAIFALSVSQFKIASRIYSDESGNSRASDFLGVSPTSTHDPPMTVSNHRALNCKDKLQDFLNGKIEQMESTSGFEKSFVTRTNTPKPFYWATHKTELGLSQASSFAAGKYFETSLTDRIARVFDTVKLQGEESIFLNVGGTSIGWYSLLATAHGATKVYTFEPKTSNVVRICESLILNGWQESVDLMTVGLGDEDTGKEALFKELDPNSPGMIPFDEKKLKESIDGNHPRNVAGEFESITLDHFAEEMGWFETKPSIVFFNLDSQKRKRLEPKIVKGAEKLFRSRIIEVFAMKIKEKAHSVEDKMMMSKIFFDSGYELHMHGHGYRGPKNLVREKFDRWEDLAQAIIDCKYGDNLLFRRKIY